MAVHNHVDIEEALATEREKKKNAKGRSLIAIQNANEAQARYEFLRRHTGTAALQNKSVFYDCEANWSVLHAYLRDYYLSAATLADLETAFDACRAAKQLVEWSEPYTRKADSSKGILPQIVRPTFEKPAPHLELTRQEIINMPKEQLRLLIKRGGPEVEREVNRILAGC